MWNMQVQHDADLSLAVILLQEEREVECVAEVEVRELAVLSLAVLIQVDGLLELFDSLLEELSFLVLEAKYRISKRLLRMSSSEKKEEETDGCALPGPRPPLRGA